MRSVGGVGGLGVMGMGEVGGWGRQRLVGRGSGKVQGVGRWKGYICRVGWEVGR